MSDDRARAAPELIGALGWAGAITHGLGTIVGDGGYPLTPTQDQQLAPLHLADLPIAILDGATARRKAPGRGDWRPQPAIPTPGVPPSPPPLAPSFWRLAELLAMACTMHNVAAAGRRVAL